VGEVVFRIWERRDGFDYDKCVSYYSAYNVISSGEKIGLFKSSTNSRRIKIMISPHETSVLAQNIWNIVKKIHFQKLTASMQSNGASSYKGTVSKYFAALNKISVKAILLCTRKCSNLKSPLSVICQLRA